ncbi:MAG: SpaA isopeptide-forming pilin-related protein [Anaerococcus sp.]|uniref:SpaA isopeptide-forming pilin-related protein n=1 Tax=Anaerococcus sp. TaxID=1872515 RepID=UPI0029112FB8|nr:SpaA isopeptide-forming pilin-related protein [Anaerococcus sp.]MDU4026397.1 SpaA isopeptide-forming pilin-related protein [Anaerococcus sp.]
MNNKFQQFSVKLLASTLAVIMAVPIDAFAMKQKQDRSYAASTSVMDSQEIKNDISRQTDQPSLLKSEISTEERDHYIIEKSATLSKATGQVDYKIVVKAKDPSKESTKEETTTFAITENTDQEDLNLEKVSGLDQDGRESEVKYTLNTPKEFNSTSNIRTLAVSSNHTKYGMVYYLSAKLSDEAQKELANKSPQLALDFTLASSDKEILQDRYTLEILKTGNNEVSVDNEGNIVNNTERLVEKEDDLHLYKGAYKEAKKSLFQSTPEQIIWTDYINSKDDKQFTYNFNVDDNQDTRDSQIKIEFYQADKIGYVLNESFTKTLNYSPSLSLQVPQGYLAKVELVTRPKENTNAKEYVFNGRKILNPKHKSETKSKEDKSKQEDDEDPDEDSSKDIKEKQSQSRATIVEDSDKKGESLEISDIEEKPLQAGSELSTSYPYSVEYTSSSTVRYQNGDKINSAIPDMSKNPEVWWDVEIDTSKIDAADIGFNNLYYTLYMGAKDGLDNFKYKASTDKSKLDDNSGYRTASTNAEFLYQANDNITKRNLGDKLYIRVKAPLDKDSEVHKEYSLGVRINPDQNYIDSILKAFLDKYDSLPTPFKWKIGDNKADKFKNKPFDLLDERIVATPNFTKYDIEDEFYFDSTRSVTAERYNDTRINWNILDLIRAGEKEDPGIANSRLNPKANENLKKYYYRPNIDGGYSRINDDKDIKLEDGTLYPGTIVAYNFSKQEATKTTKYSLSADLAKKEDKFKVLVDSMMNSTKDLKNPVGGQIQAYTHKQVKPELDDKYLAYYENPFGIMRINQNFDMVACYNDGFETPIYNGQGTKIGLDRIVDPDADLLYAMLEGNNVQYAKDNLKAGGKFYQEGKEPKENLKDALKRVYYYTDQVISAKEKEDGKKIPRKVRELLYQKMVHYITNNKPVDEQYGISGKFYDPSVKNWVDKNITLTGNEKDKYFTDKDGEFRAIPNDERRIKNNDNEALEEARQLAEKATRTLKASYNNSDWNDDKANSVELIFYKHQYEKRFQHLITAKVYKPITAQKLDIDGSKLAGAEFNFINKNTGESHTWTSKADNSNNPLYLKPGQYYVDETHAPDGYSELKTFQIEIKEEEINPDDGEYPQYGLDIHVNDGHKYALSILNEDTIQKDGSGNPLVSVDEDTLKLNIKNEDNKLGSIRFTKTNGRRAIDGAEFTLTKINSEDNLEDIDKLNEKPVYQKTSTGNNGEFSFSSIPEGIYKLEETKAPTGYQAIKPLILIATKAQDGKVSVKFKDEKIEESKEIINKSPSTELSFRKIKKTEEGEKIVPIDSGTGSFRLYSTNTVDDSSYDRTVSPSSTVVEKDEEKGTPALQVGEFKFTELVAGDYILVEEQAPIGFEKPDFPFWSVKVTEKDGKLSYEVNKLNKDTDPTPINESDIIDNENKVVGKTFNIENKARTINHKFKKYIDNADTPMDNNLKGEDGEPVSFRLYEADYYGLKKDPNDKGKRIVADENGDFNLTGLEYSSYYLLEEENPPAGYGKASATVLYVQSEAEVQTGKMSVVVRDHTNNTLTADHNVFKGIIDYEIGDSYGNLLVKKTGDSLIEGDDSEVGLRRAYFRLYYADQDFNYANEKFERVDGIEESDYIQRVSAGIALTDNEGNPIAKENLPNDQGIVKFENLKPGNYILIEHRGPAGYEKDTNPRYIHVTKSGKVIKSVTKNNPSLKEEEVKDPNLFDTGNTNVFSRILKKDNKSNKLMLNEATESRTPQKASQADKDTWEKVLDYRSEKPYRGQDPAGNDINTTKITEINKGSKRFRQVFLLENPKEQTLIANIHRQPLSSIVPGDLDIKLSYVDSDSSFDDLKNPKIITKFKYTKNINDSHIRFETTEKIPANATIALEVETSYKDNIGLGVDFFYEHDTADERGWKNAWVAQKYNNEDEINTKPSEIVEEITKEEVLKYETKTEETNELEEGYTQVKQYGKNGKKITRYKVTYIDGKLKSEDPIGDPEIIKPIDEIILVGTKKREAEIPTGDGKVKVNFLYNNMDDNGHVEESASVDKNAGKMSLQIKKADDWYDISEQSKDVPLAGSIDFENLDPDSTYRLVYSRDQILAEKWGLPRTSSYNINLSKVDGDTFEFTISNGNLLRVFNKDETGFRIPLRISKKDENGSPLSGAQFTAKKIIKGKEGKYADEEFDVVSEATGLSGDNYFRELSPGIYELTETRSPRPQGVTDEEGSDYLLPKDKDGNDQKWYFEVKQNPEQKDPRAADYMIIDFKFSHTFKETDEFTEAGEAYDSKDWYGKTIYGTEPVDGADGKVANEDFMKLIKLVPDDHRSNPARPDAPYKKINDLEVTNVKKKTDFSFIKSDEYSKALENAKFRLRKLATDDKGNIQKTLTGGEYKFDEDKDKELVYDETVTSNLNEGVSFKDIPEGKYLLEETTAPEGYEKLEKPIIVEFKISPATGKWEQTLVEDKDNGINYDYYNKIISKRSQGGISQIKNKKAYTKLEFTKVDQKGDDVKVSAFRLDKLDEKGNVVNDDSDYPQTRRNWNKAKFTFDNLSKGKYKLTETNPTNYQRPNPTYFEVVEDENTGKLKIVFDENEKNITVEKDKDENTTDIKFTNFDKINFDFTKIGDGKTDRPLQGAVFTLKKVLTEKGGNAKQIYDNDGKIVEELSDYAYYAKASSGSDGKVSFTDLSQGVYELEETKAPYGYERLNAQRKWIVYVEKNEKGDGLEVKYDKEYEKSYYKDDKSYNENDQNILTINKDRNTLSNTSNTTELKFNKVDRDGDVIASDTTFTLTKLSHNPDDLDNLETISSYIDYTTLREEDGTFKIKDLDRGLYVLSETNPPKDYKKADRDIVLQIIEGDDGKLVINSYEKDEDDNLIKSDRFKYLDNTKNPIEIANDKEAQYIIFNKVTNAIFGYSNIESGELELTISKYNDSINKASDLVDTLKFDLKDTKSINKIYIEDAAGTKKLKDGKYLIKETKAPEGYVMTNRSYLVEISTKDDVAIAKLLEVQDSKGNAITDESGNKITDTGEQIPEGGLEITDKKGGSNFKIVNNNPTLPSTGGNGTFIGFALIGTAIMIAAIAYYGIYINDKNRRRSNRYNK